MGSRERRERQRQATREGILNAALQIARTEGWGAVTVRRVADLIEYTPPIIYEYFTGKDALLEELQDRGFASLADGMRQASSTSGTARERLLRTGDAYLAFAYQQPELYQLMHGWSSGVVDVDRTLARATPVAQIVQNRLEEWAETEKIDLPDPAGAVETLWGLLHGLVSVEMLGRIGGGPGRTYRLARQGTEDLLTAWAVR